MISIVIAAALAADVPAAQVTPLYSVKQKGRGLGWVDEDVTIAEVAPPSTASQAPRFWVVEQRRIDDVMGRHDAGGKVLERPGWTLKHQWIDGRGCQALDAAIVGLRALLAKDAAAAAGPEAGSRGGPRDIEMPVLPPSDTPQVTVATSRGEPMEVSDYRGPVSKWWWETERELATCWNAAPPVVDGQPMAPLISGPWIFRPPW